jgi:hypothetical protein
MAGEIPVGFCQCGCGERTPIANQTRLSRGAVKGRPTLFLNGGHAYRVKAPSLALRLRRRVLKTDTCWLWQGVRDRAGYGLLGVGGRKAFTHRIAWELEHGPIPSGLHVLHTCDVRNCVRPSHLFLGDQTANNADMVAKGRNRGVAGELHPAARLTREDVQRIRDAYAAAKGDGSLRACRERLAQELGVTAGHIIAIQLGNAWRSVGGAA